MEKETFVNRLEDLMKKKELSRKELAKVAGVSIQTIGNYLNGTRLPDFYGFRSLATALNVSADYLLGLSDVASSNTTVRDIHEVTGLSEKAISNLSVSKSVCESEHIEIINHFLESYFMHDLTASIWFYLSDTTFQDMIVEGTYAKLEKEAFESTGFISYLPFGEMTLSESKKRIVERRLWKIIEELENTKFNCEIAK